MRTNQEIENKVKLVAQGENDQWIGKTRIWRVFTSQQGGTYSHPYRCGAGKDFRCFRNPQDLIDHLTLTIS